MLRSPDVVADDERWARNAGIYGGSRRVSNRWYSGCRPGLRWPTPLRGASMWSGTTARQTLLGQLPFFIEFLKQGSVV